MASDYVVRLTGDNSNLQNALNQTKKALQETGQASSKIEDIQKQFDKTANGSANLRRKIADVKKQMEQLAVAGLDGTEAGKQMWDKLSEAAKQYQATLDKVNGALKEEVVEMKEEKDASEELKEKIANLRKEMELLALAGQNKTPMFDDMARQVAELEKAQKKASNAVNDSVGKQKGMDFKGMGQEMANKMGVGEAFGAITAAANPATLAIAATAGTMIAAGKAAGEFEVHLDSLQALTGATDQEVKRMGDSAVELSKKFGGSAGEIVDSMGLIGSQAPELLADGEALSFVTDAAMTLGKAGSIAVEDAAKAITTVMNQMGVSGDEAMNIANVIEAAEQKGSASVDYLSTAIEKSGTMAKNAGLSYVELAAMIETIGPKFSSADVAGTGLQSTLLALTSQTNNDYNPAIVGMSKALENLNAAHLSTAEMSKLVGQSNVAMISTMMEGVDTFENFANVIDGTNAAEEAAAMKMDNMAGAVDKLKAQWDAFLITLGQSGLIQGIADNIMMVMSALGEMLDVVDEVIEAFDGFGGEGVENVNLLKVQLDLFLGILKAVGEVVAVVVRIVSKGFEEIRNKVGEVGDWIGEKWVNLKKQLGDVAFAKFVINAFDTIMNKVGKVIDQIKKWWNDLKSSLGLEVKAEADTKPRGTSPADRKAQEEANRKTIAEDQKKRNEEGAARKKAEKDAKKKTKKETKTKEQKEEEVRVSVDDNSLDLAEKKLSAFEAKKKALPITATAEIAEADKEIAKWKEEVKKRKIALGIEPSVEDGSVNDLQEKIKKLTEKKTLLLNTKADPTAVREIEDEIKGLEKSLKEEKIRVGLLPDPDSLNGIKERIKDLQNELTLALNTNLDPDKVKDIINQLDALRKQEKAKSIELGVTVQPTIAPKEEKLEKGNTLDKRQSLSNAKSQSEQIKADYKVGIIGKEEAMAQLKELDTLLSELQLKPLELHVNDDGTITSSLEELEKYKEKMGSVSDTIGSMGSVFGSLGSAIGGSTGEIMNFAGQSLNAIAQVLPQIVTLITAKQAEAMASGTASAASMPFPANIAAIAGIVATVASLFASLPKFESGGIVGGTSYHGDKLLARVNSGEMILNQKQQANLANTLGAVGAQGGGIVKGDIRLDVSGRALKGVLKNTDKKASKIR